MQVKKGVRGGPSAEQVCRWVVKSGDRESIWWMDGWENGNEGTCGIGNVSCLID